MVMTDNSPVVWLLSWEHSDLDLEQSLHIVGAYASCELAQRAAEALAVDKGETLGVWRNNREDLYASAGNREFYVDRLTVVTT